MKRIIIVFAILIADQIVKWQIRLHLQPGEVIPVLGAFFRITYVRNAGVAFGLFAGKTLLLQLLALGIVIGVWIYLKKQSTFTHPMMEVSLAMILAGGIGNVIDRLIFGVVTDMFSFSIFPPVFNVADIAVVLGCALLAVVLLFDGYFNDKRGKNH